MKNRQAPEYRLPPAKPGTTQRQIRLFNKGGALVKTVKCKPTCTNTTMPFCEGFLLQLVDLPDEKPLLEFVVPARMPLYFDLATKCEISVNPPTPPTGNEQEPSPVQHVLEPLPLHQQVSVQVVRATDDPTKMTPAERIAKGYRPELVDGKVQWTKATDSGNGQ